MTVFHTTLRGTILTGSINEIFSHSLGIESAANETTVATAIRDAWITLWGTAALGMGEFFPTGVVYEEVTAARVIDPMVPDLGAAAHVPFLPPLPGRSGTGILPSQCAFAISLTAGVRSNGKPLKGRFFLPPPAQNTTLTSGVLPDQSTANIADIFKVFLDTLMADGHWPSVWSRTEEDLVGTVTTVRVGNKIDTIRSRRNRHPEVYAVRALVGPQ